MPCMYRFADNQFDTTATVVRKIAVPELGFCLTKILRIFALFVQVSAATHNHASNATCTTTCCSVQSDLSEQHAPSLPTGQVNNATRFRPICPFCDAVICPKHRHVTDCLVIWVRGVIDAQEKLVIFALKRFFITVFFPQVKSSLPISLLGQPQLL